MGAYISAEDLQLFDPSISTARADAMIEDAEAVVNRAAPCLRVNFDADVRAIVKATLRRALLRWASQGSGELKSWSETAGPFAVAGSVDTRGSASRGILYPSELDELKALCDSGVVEPKARRGWLL